MRKQKEQQQWKGQAVAPAPTGEAEGAAERAAGRRPVPVQPADADERLDQQAEEGERRAASHEDPAEKVEDAAEEHRERSESDKRPRRGRL